MSSISSISSNTNIYQKQFQQTRTDFSTLQSSLSSGNLTAAQQAYAALTQDIQNAQQTQGGQQAEGTNQLGTDLTAVGSALQSGNITSAQSAFATLTQDLESMVQTQGGQEAHGHHHHHHHGASSQTASTSSQTADTSLSADLAAVGSALQSGNITSAQSAFATFMQDLGNGTTSGSNSLFQAVGSNINIAV
jgi:soluble cytochrome b562